MVHPPRASAARRNRVLLGIFAGISLLFFVAIIVKVGLYGL